MFNKVLFHCIPVKSHFFEPSLICHQIYQDVGYHQEFTKLRMEPENQLQKQRQVLQQKKTFLLSKTSWIPTLSPATLPKN